MNSEITSGEIKRIRQRYGLSQQAFARALGIGEASIVRYENGQKPTRANTNLIRAARDGKFMLDCLERAADSISAQQRKNAEEIIYAEISFNEKGEVMDINEIYALTLQQEILNEQAAGILGELSRRRREAEREDDRILMSVLEDIRFQIILAKERILGASTETELAEVRGNILGLEKLSSTISAKAA